MKYEIIQSDKNAKVRFNKLGIIDLSDSNPFLGLKIKFGVRVYEIVDIIVKKENTPVLIVVEQVMPSDLMKLL
jgi:hypothetical protein